MFNVGCMPYEYRKTGLYNDDQFSIRIAASFIQPALKLHHKLNFPKRRTDEH